MEFRVLGPLEAEDAGVLVPLGPQKQRALLAVLLLRACETVSSGRLIEDLWDGEPPERADKSIQTYVSRLRKVLPGDLLCTRPHGYELRLERGCLDLHEFERLAGDGRAALAQGDVKQAAAEFRDALALWRGTPLAEFDSEPFAARESARLDDLRLAALEDRIDADLAGGRHADVVGELESLIVHHPFRERLRGQLMLALYRSGRQAEALAAFQDARRTLVEELGIEPGRSLQDLERAILRHDLGLELERISQPPASQPRAAEAAVDAGAFVGREPELEQLDRALGAALSGSGRLLMLAGEPGIGKTRTAAEFAAHARSRGVRVLWGRCSETEGAPPYWPWLEALRSYLGSRDHSHLGVSPAVLAELLPELRERMPYLEPAPETSDPKQARFRLLDTTTTFLIGATRTEPLVLILDDLHAADADSLMLLEFVAHRLSDAPLLIVGTFRDVELTRGHPLSHTLAELTRERLFERLPLRGLAEVDVRRFLEETLGVAPPDALVTAVHAQTEGHPLFVTEVVRLLVQEGRLTPETLAERRDWSIGVPEGVRDVLGRRLDRLSAPCNETLTVASAIGKEFALAQLGPLIHDLSEERLLEVLEEALAAHVIEEPPGAAGRYQFAHALIQGTLVDELSLTRRARLHARIAEALEELYRADTDKHAAELAHHYGEAEAVLGAGKLVHYSLIAGESALAAHAPEQALTHFQRGLAAREDQPMDDAAAELYFGLGRAQLATLPVHQLDPAIGSLRRAFDYYAEAGELGKAVAVAAHPLPLSLRFGYTDAAELSARALTLVSPDSHEAGALLATHGWFSGFIEADYDDAQRAFQKALSIAERDKDAALERRTLANAAFVDAFHLRWRDCLANGLPAVELARHAGDPGTEIPARRAVAFSLTATGEREQGRFHTSAALVHAEQLRESWWLTSTSFSNELLCLYEGDWRTAREMSDLGLGAAPRDPRHLALRAALEYELGNQDEGATCVALLQEVAGSVTPPGPIADHVFVAIVIPILGRTASAEKLDVAEAAADRVLALPRLAPALALYARSGLALIAVQRSDADAAERHYRALEAQRGTASFFVPLTFDRLLGLLALTFGRADAAVAHFADGLAFCDRAGYRPEYAWTACDYADTLLLRRGADDSGTALALQEEALAVARELDMRPLEERVLTLELSAPR